MLASLLYQLPKPNFETHNVYIFEFQVGYVNLFFKKPLFKDLIEEGLEEEKSSLTKEVEEEEVASVEKLEYLGKEELVSEPQVSIGGKVEAELKDGEDLKVSRSGFSWMDYKLKYDKWMDSKLKDDQWMDLKLEDLQINALTTKEEYRMKFMKGIEIKPITKRVTVSSEVKAILYSLDKIKTTKEDIKTQIDLLDIEQGLLLMNRNEEVERQYETYEKSDNPAKNFSEPEGFFETFDLEDLPLPCIKKLKVSMALYDIKMIHVDEDRFIINMPKEKTEMEEQEDSEIIYNVEDIRLIPTPQFPFDEGNLSQININNYDLKNKCTFKAITSLTPRQMIDRIKTIPLLIDISEHDRLAMKRIKTIGMSKLGYLGNRFVDVIKTNAEPNAPTPNSCIKDVILPIIDNHDEVVGEIKVILKLKCYNKRAWPDLPPRLPMTPSMIELLECEHLIIESTEANTSDLSGEQLSLDDSEIPRGEEEEEQKEEEEEEEEETETDTTDTEENDSESEETDSETEGSDTKTEETDTETEGTDTESEGTSEESDISDITENSISDDEE